MVPALWQLAVYTEDTELQVVSMKELFSSGSASFFSLLFPLLTCSPAFPSPKSPSSSNVHGVAELFQSKQHPLTAAGVRTLGETGFGEQGGGGRRKDNSVYKTKLGFKVT